MVTTLKMFGGFERQMTYTMLKRYSSSAHKTERNYYMIMPIGSRHEHMNASAYQIFFFENSITYV